MMTVATSVSHQHFSPSPLQNGCRVQNSEATCIGANGRKPPSSSTLCVDCIGKLSKPRKKPFSTIPWKLFCENCREAIRRHRQKLVESSSGYSNDLDTANDDFQSSSTYSAPATPSPSKSLSSSINSADNSPACKKRKVGKASSTFILSSRNYNDETSEPKYSTNLVPSIFHKLTALNQDWCRFCGTTDGLIWRDGPWGKRTLCNKHGFEYRNSLEGKTDQICLSLLPFKAESSGRKRPVIQEFCNVCHLDHSSDSNPIYLCHGCPRALHLECHTQRTEFEEIIQKQEPWFCLESCRTNYSLNSMRVILSKNISLFFPEGIVPFKSIKTAKRCTLILDVSQIPCINMEMPVSSDNVQISVNANSTSLTEANSRKTNLSCIKNANIQWIFPDAELPALLNRTQISVPKWIRLTSLPPHSLNEVEDISIVAALSRHEEYENFERKTRILVNPSLMSERRKSGGLSLFKNKQTFKS